MRIGVLSVIFALWSGAAAAQPVTVLGPVTPGDVPEFNSPTVIKDSGVPAAAFVTGPATSVLGDCATWANLIGTKLADTPCLQIFGTQLANTVFAGPTTGSAAFPTWRSLLIADISNFPTPTRAGDIIYWNGTAWVSLAGNNSGTNVLTENASGVPSWAAAGAGTLTTLTAGTGITLSSGATCTTTCTVSLTTPVSVANGGTGGSTLAVNQVLAGAGTGPVTTVGNGQTGLALIGNGTGSSLPSFQSGPWTLLATLTASNSASLNDQTSCNSGPCITSSYNEYEIVLENILPATTSNSCEFQLYSTTLQTTSYQANALRFQGATVAGGASTTFIPCDAASAALVNSGSGVSGRWTLFKPSQTTSPKMMTGEFSEAISGGTVTGQSGGAWIGGNTAITGISIQMNSGNITSGVMKIYGRL